MAEDDGGRRGHPSAEDLQAFTAGTLDEGERAVCFAHLRDCPPCLARLAALTGGGRAPAGEAPGLLRRAHLFALARGEADYGRLLEEAENGFEALPPEDLPAYVELCLELSDERRDADVEEAEDFAYFAVEAAEAIPEEVLGAAQTADLLSRAWTEIANFRRVANNQIGAANALQLSKHYLEDGTGAGLLLARHLDVAGSFLRAERRFEEAIGALEDAHALYLEHGERHRAGRVLVTLAYVHMAAGQPERAVTVLWSAFQLIDARKAPAVALNATHNMLHALADSGHGGEVAKALWTLRPQFKKGASRLDQARLMWLEARLWIADGVPGRAERLLRKVIATFTAEDLLYDASLAALDLAPVLLEKGRLADLLALLNGAVRTFAGLHIHRELSVALGFLSGAIQRGTASRAALDRFRELLERTGDTPRLG
jgi:tetratricopeptide (TPR) repeat protein